MPAMIFSRPEEKPEEKMGSFLSVPLSTGIMED